MGERSSQNNGWGNTSWVPFDYQDNNGQYSGIANDYLNLIAAKTGLAFEIIVDTWSNQLQRIRSKKLDLIGAAYFTEEREKYATYSKPYFEVLDYFFIRDDLDVKKLSDLNGKRVAIPKDYAYSVYITKNFPGIKVLTVDDFEDSVDAVLENRADMLYDSYAVLTAKLKKEGIGTIIPF